jgi:hypothetical protein
MKKLLFAVALLAVSAPLALVGQDLTSQLKDYTRVLPGDGLQLSLVYLNQQTVAAIFQPPTLYAMRARAKEATMLYVQGTPSRQVELDTTNFTIEQGGQSITSQPTNIKNFMKGKAKVGSGETITGVLTFMTAVDVSKPFTVKHAKDSIEFKFSADQIKAMAPAPPAH